MSEVRKPYPLGAFTLVLILLELGILALMLGGYTSLQKVNPSLSLHQGEYFPFVASLALLSLGFLVFIGWRNQVLLRAAGDGLLPNLAPKLSSSRVLVKFILWRVALSLLGLALLGPKIASKVESTETRGIDLMVALDVSNSMLAEDLEPSRMEHAKRIVQRFIGELQGDRIGIVIFAGDAYVQLPLTSDVSSAKVFLDAISPGIVPTQGTAIGAALDLCMESFDPESDAGRMILLITDGENHEDDAIEAAERAGEEGVKICAIGAGLPEGAPIPRYNNREQRIGFRTDAQGNTIVTALNENLLIDIVKAGEGVFVRSNAQSTSLTSILDVKDQVKKGELGSSSFTDYEHLFPFFVLAALVFFGLDLFIGERKRFTAWKID